MRFLILLSIIIGFNFTGLSQISVQGSPCIELNPDASTGLKKVIVVKDVSQAVLSYSATSESVIWERFSSLGGGYAEPVKDIRKDGKMYSIYPEPNMGYIITDGISRICFWVCNYADYPYNITEVIPAENGCDRLMLNVLGSADEMPYYTVTGRRMVVDREVTFTYSTLVYDSENRQYIQTSRSEKFASVHGSVSIHAPLCSTSITVTPGKFALAWNEGREIESQWVEPEAVEASVYAIQTERESDNEQMAGNDSGSLGGSAPCEITFSAAVTDAAIYRRWEFSTSPNFEDVQLSFSDLSLTYTFEEAGTTYVRFVADNASGTCPYESEVFVITIGDSRLECPNAFSPGASEGVNDEWKVSYRSIIEFHCEIFNRWGQRLVTLTDPSQGWDGIVGGKPVPSGVYFYVIKARGSDGKEYKLSGDINVVSSRKNTSVGNSME